MTKFSNMKPAYKVVQKFNEFPEIVKADLTDVTGKSWRDAKKECREKLMAEVEALRAMTEKSYFADHGGGQ